jgi:hypothetical protein
MRMCYKELRVRFWTGYNWLSTHTSCGYSYFVQLYVQLYISGVGRAIAQAVSRWLPTAAARVKTRV